MQRAGISHAACCRAGFRRSFVLDAVLFELSINLGRVGGEEPFSRRRSPPVLTASMDFLWGVIAIVIVAILVVADAATLVLGLSSHRRDVRIVDMRNRGCSVSEIAKALNSTGDEV